MNMNQVKRHYDKLTAKERFALMMKAHGREDNSEVKELIRSAPRKVFSFPDTHGLSEGFQFLVMFHMLTQLNDVASFYFLVLAQHDEEHEIKVGDNTYTISDAFELIQRNIIGGRDAFRAICKEYNLDPDEMVKDYPYTLTIEIGELFARLGAGEMIEERKAELERYTQETIEGYRLAIDHHAEGW
jgi:hypothetical protein